MLKCLVITATHLKTISVGINSGIGSVFEVTILKRPAIFE